jgi:glycosyltransferase involved in cell wall biosynthesis
MKRILFFHQGRIADWAGAIHRGISNQFPSAEIINFDLHNILKARSGFIVKNLVAAVGRYGGDLLLGKRDLDDAFFTTPYVFEEIRKISREIHEKYPSDFSFQVHSMHDHSSNERPHFVYTDFTYENCKSSSFYGRFKWAPKRSDKLIELEFGIYRRSNCTFSQTQSVASMLMQKYEIPENNVLNVKYGPNLSQDLLNSLGVGLDRYHSKTIIFVGGDWNRKGGPDLMAAFSLLRREIPDAKLLVIGCNPECDPAVAEVVGRIPLDSLVHYYARAAVFCMPSKLEPSASVYVEAMHAGLPVVALRSEPTSELVVEGVTGHLVSSGDIQGLADKLASLLLSPVKCREMGINARRFVECNYTWENTFNCVGDRIRKVIN